MYSQGLHSLVLLLLVSSLFVRLPALPQSFSLSLRSGLGSTSSCRLSQSESERRCRSPGGKLCSGRGQCDCGVCICQVTEPGKYYGPLCECHEWVCETYDGDTCA
ncbi:Integrin beta-like protein 1, partial [Varanus komodoensis]